MEVFSTKIPEAINNILSHTPSLSAFNAVIACTAVLAFIKLMRMSRNRLRTTKLRGPPSSSFAYGVGKILLEADDPASIYESWAHEYGAAYDVPSTLLRRRIILYDPKAIAHFHAKQSWTYVRTPFAKKALEYGFGRGLFWADGESHRRQRKSLTPAFSIAAIRNLTPIFNDSAHKAKGAWNSLIESSGEESAIIDVQSCLDTIGLAGFSHDFAALEGKHASVTEIFDTFTSSTSKLNIGLFLLAQVFPFLVRVPTARRRLTWKLNRAMEEISNTLLARTKKELDLGVVGDKEEKSLSRHPDIQTKLRNELLEHGSDATYDQLVNGLPYLDAVVHEILRIHPPVREATRVAAEDDIIPLSEAVRTKSGQLVDNLSIAKGTVVSIPLASVNLSTVIWGDDAKVFKPSRWLEDDDGHNGIPAKAREVQGHRHLLTFSDGPRNCLGKNFAVTEFKAVLSVLVKNFFFELRDGAETKIEMGRGFLPRPRVAGEVGCKMPLRVKPYVG
ncbi:cytochrome P450 [Imleria badia]|nr:cytochrome P450 [Imleria badia]